MVNLRRRPRSVSRSRWRRRASWIVSLPPSDDPARSVRLQICCTQTPPSGAQMRQLALPHELP